MKHFAIVVRGMVQGVLFRSGARERARELGITGFARNLPDGSVYFEAEGEEDALREFVLWCKKGPPHARVSDVIITEEAVKGFQDFAVER